MNAQRKKPTNEQSIVHSCTLLGEYMTEHVALMMRESNIEVVADVDHGSTDGRTRQYVWEEKCMVMKNSRITTILLIA